MANPVLVLERVPVTLRFELLASCPDATAIEASVLDPSSNVVDSTASVAGHLGTLTFTPPREGPYHVTVRLQPNRGMAQADVTAARDRRAEPGLPIELSPEDLAGAELTDAGRLLSPLTLRVHTLEADGGVRSTQQLPGAGLVAAGDVAWTFTDAGVSRWVLEGTAYVMSPDASIAAPTTRVFPTERDVVILASGEVTVGTVTASGFDVRAYPVQESFVSPAHVVGRQLTTFAPNRWSSTEIGGDGGYRYLSLPTSIGMYWGGDANGFWGDLDNSVVLHRSATEPVGTLFYREGLYLTSLYLRTELPRINAAGLDLAAAEANNRIVLEHWGTLVSATATTIITRTDAGVLLLRRR